MRKALIVSLPLLLAGELSTNAQTTVSTREIGPEAMVYDPTPNAGRARELWTRAEELLSQPNQWKKAARLLEQSARLREPNDPEAYTCLMYAGHLRFAVNDLVAARSNLEMAASHALAHGAVLEAAHAYIYAAHAAIAEKQIDVARDLVRRAALLSESPLLSAEQRHALESRLRLKASAAATPPAGSLVPHSARERGGTSPPRSCYVCPAWLLTWGRESPTGVEHGPR